MSSTPHVVVLDSGVGSLSIAQEILQAIPEIRLTAFADRQHFPYGELSEIHLIERFTRLAEQAVEHLQPDLIVVACNTASTLALPTLRHRWSIPIVGVVPAIKPAAQLSRSGVIALLATRATVNRPYTHDLINQFAKEHEVLCLACPELVALAEARCLGTLITSAQLRQAAAPLLEHAKAEQIDTVVMACTHFPLLTDQLQPMGQPHWQWIDSGKAIARRVATLLGRVPVNGNAQAGLTLVATGASSYPIAPLRDLGVIHSLILSEYIEKTRPL